MICIQDKKECCGCVACMQICPQKCITMPADAEGFCYPIVDLEACIDCGLCEKVCPVLHQGPVRAPLQVYAAHNNDEFIRRYSSSGGIFMLLAESVIREGGVVFGACFDENWEVRHAYAETIERVAAFQGSKYMQSRIEESFVQVRTFLKQGRKVLFSGTPCQIAGLHRFLRHKQANLLTVDFVCHGVPSPKVWQMYLEDYKCSQAVNKEKPSILGVDFRSKSTGWRTYSFQLLLLKKRENAAGQEVVRDSSPYRENPFMQVFHADLCLRPSCHACPAKSGRSGSDLTIGDFWGIEDVLPDFDTDKGTSLVLIHTEEGAQRWHALNCTSAAVSYTDALRKNPSLEHSVPWPGNRAFFFFRLRRAGFTKAHRQQFDSRLIWRLCRLLYRKILA